MTTAGQDEWSTTFATTLGRHASVLAHAAANLDLVAELQAHAKTSPDVTLLEGLKSLRLRAAMLARALPNAARAANPKDVRAATARLLADAWQHVTGTDARDAGSTLAIRLTTPATLTWQEARPSAFFLVDAVVHDLAQQGAKSLWIAADQHDDTIVVTVGADDLGTARISAAWMQATHRLGMSAAPAPSGLYALKIEL